MRAHRRRRRLRGGRGSAAGALTGPPRWSALLLAGQRPGRDPLAAAFGEAWKARVEVAGEPMLAHVLRTLLACPEIARIVVAAQRPEALLAPPLDGFAADARVATAASGAGISASVAALAGSPAAPWPVLVTTADHPLLTPAMVAEFLAGAAGADLAIGMVERRTLLAAYPENRRTWLRFRGGAWSGANLFALAGPRVAPALALWADAERDRKRAWRLFRRFGPWLALRALTRTITGPGAIEAAGRRLGFMAKLVPLSQAEAAIDVDKPADHALAEEILARRSATFET